MYSSNSNTKNKHEKQKLTFYSDLFPMRTITRIHPTNSSTSFYISSNHTKAAPETIKFSVLPLEIVQRKILIAKHLLVPCENIVSSHFLEDRGIEFSFHNGLLIALWSRMANLMFGLLIPYARRALMTQIFVVEDNFLDLVLDILSFGFIICKM